MAFPLDTRDKTSASQGEAAWRGGLTEGVTAFITAVMTPAQYLPTPSQTAARDIGRTIMGGVAYMLRALPLRLPVYTVATLPPAGDHTGAQAYVSNGAAGAPVVAFSDGSTWKRCDTLAAVSP